MTKTLSFSVEDAKLIKENPDSNFAVLSLDFFASGDNLHNLWVSENTLMRTADTIKNCPIVWKYDERLDDIYTHDADEVPCGFVPESSAIKSRKMSDGRTMLSVIAYVWKRYTGQLLDIFKRDGGTKPVSVEMEVYEMKDLPNGKTELADFKYEGITVLGSFVTPAIRSAQATVLSFADIATEYQEVYEKEFSSPEVTNTIPNSVKDNVEKGLELRKSYGKGGTSDAISSAHYLLNNETISPEKARYFAKYLSRHKSDSLLDANPPTDGQIAWLLWGGTEGYKWIETLVEELEQSERDKIDYANDKTILTFPYKSKGEMNPALKGIHPPVSLAQANAIARQADAIGTDEKKNGWAIAISNFKKTHKVVDGRWVKKDMSMAEDLGKGEALNVDKSKEKLSTTAWGSVDKTTLMHKVLNASNYKSLVKDVYMLVEAGWEEHPSSSLKYPVMQLVGNTLVYNRYGLSAALQRAKGQGENEVVNKVSAIYKHLGLNETEQDSYTVQDTYLSTETSRKEEQDMGDNILENMKPDMPEEKMEEEKQEEKMEQEEKIEKNAEEKPEEEMAKDVALAQDKKEEETPAEDKKETPEDEKKEDEKMSMPVAVSATMSVDTILSFMESEAPLYQSMGDEYGRKIIDIFKNFANEVGKGQFAVAKNLTDLLVSFMAEATSKISDMKVKLAEANSELENLRTYKKDVEAEKFAFEVDSVLAEAFETGMPKESIDALREDAKEFTLESIDVYKNMVKAKAFVFVNNSKLGSGTDDFVKIGLPFSDDKPKSENLWE